MLKQVEKYINELPPLNESIQKINESLANPVEGFAILVKTIEKDPLLTALILNAANSPLYGFSSKIGDIKRAVSLLGLNTVTGIALNVLIKNMFKINFLPYNLSEQQFLELSLKYNLVAKQVCSNEKLHLLKIISPISFLLEIGKAISSQIIIQNNLTDLFIEKAKSGMPYYLIEKELIGISSYEITGLILKKFNFNQDLVDILLNIFSQENLVNEKLEVARLLIQIINMFDNKFNLKKEGE